MKRCRNGLTTLRVSRRIGGAPHQGRLNAGDLILPCALGRAGITQTKREGDGATPAGRVRLLYLFARRGRVSLAGVKPPVRFVGEGDIWCDDAKSALYNRPLRRPFAARHENLWRADRLYDVIGVLDWNLRPSVRGRGSAIFFHIATDDLSPTAGCVALRARDMARLLPRLARGATLYVE